MKNEEVVDKTTITVPKVSGDQAEQSTELVEQMIKKYKMNQADAGALFQGMVAIYIRGRMVYGDRQPTFCSFGAACSGEDAN